MPSAADPILVRVLGPTEVAVDGRLLRLGGQRQRALLALLVLRRNTPVAGGEIAEAIWPEPGANAENTVQVYVSRLRHTLGKAGQYVESTAAGYRLLLEDRQLDAARFQRLVAEGHGLLEADDPRAARLALSDALRLWNGDAFADLRYEEIVQPERQRLEDMRHIARLDLARAELRSGDPRAALATIQSALVDASLDESAWAILMGALYAQGRQADALAAYHTIRTRLDEDLGVQPSQELEEMQRLILRRDPTLLPPGVAHAASSTPVVTAAPIPTPLSPLVGRTAEMERLARLLADYRLLTLTGPGGVGKTRLGLAIAQSLADRFPGGVGFIDLSSVREPTLVPAAIRDALGIDCPSERDPTEAVISALRSERALLVLDNFEQVVDAAPFVRRLLSSASDLRVLATSRAALGINGEREVQVGPLAPPPTGANDLPTIDRSDAVTLFMDVVERHGGSQLTEANAETVAEICRRLDGLPLALELVASHSRTMSLASILRHLHDRLDLSGSEADVPARQRTLRAAIEWSVELLEPTSREMLARASVFVGGFTHAAAEALAGNAFQVHRALTELTRHSLVVFDGELERFRILETIREFGVGDLAARGAVQETRERQAEWLAKTIAEAEEAYSRAEDRLAALNRSDAERGNVRDVLAWAARSGRESLSLRLASGKNFWAVRGGVLEGLGWLQDLLSRSVDYPPRVLAAGHSTLGGLAMNVGDLALARAEFASALPLWEGLAERRRVAVIHNNLGIVAERLDELDECRARTEAALAIMRELGDQIGMAAALGNLGVLAERLGDIDGSVRYNAEALEIARQLDDPLTMSIATTNLGGAALKRGHLPEAAGYLREALDLSSRLNDVEGMIICWELLAQIAGLSGRHHSAVELISGAARQREESGFAASPEQAREIAQVIAAAREALAEQEHAEAILRGSAKAGDQLNVLALDVVGIAPVDAAR
jgi:predicted ATPase/DNA-binding SARP family transcriptional activator